MILCFISINKLRLIMMQMGRLMVLLILAVVLMVSVTDAATTLPNDALVRQYYKKNDLCRDLETYVKHQVGLYMEKDKSVAPKLARLLYSDCMVTGCDASILLDGLDSERNASQNVGLGGFALIDKIKQVVEERCPNKVSCADILNLATRDAIHLAGGPSYIIRTGRKDGVSSKSSTVDLPSPSISLKDSLAYFQSKGLDVQDMTTLLGVHSIGKVRCRYLMDRLYNYKGTGKADPTMDPSLLRDLMTQCPKTKKKGEHEGIVYMNPESGPDYTLSNRSYNRILTNNAVLGVDQQLLYSNDTLQLTQEFADSFEDYKMALALSMARMGEIGVLTGSSGEIRKHCAYTNKNNPFLN